MAYDDEQASRSRVVVDTPTSRREVTQTETVHNDRGGMSGATVGVIVVVAIALITVVVLFLMNGQQAADNANANLAAQQAAQQQPIAQQPAAQQPPIIIQQPAAAPQQQPVVITQPAGGETAPANTSNDGAVQMAIDKKIGDDPTLSALGITATVLDGKVTLTGTVKSEALKSQLDKAIRSVKGVKQVDNQIAVMA